MSVIVNKLRSKPERTYRVLTLVLGIILWPLFVLGVLAGLGNQATSALIGVYLAYGLLIWLFYYLARLIHGDEGLGVRVQGSVARLTWSFGLTR